MIRFLKCFAQIISFFTIAKNIITNNKIILTCLYKNSYNSQLQYKYYKNNFKYLQYYHLLIQNYSNMAITKKNKDTTIVL